MMSRFSIALTFLALAGISFAQQSPAPPKAQTLNTLDAALNQVETAIEVHDWLTLLDLADSENLATQRGLGMGHAQYLMELLGLGYEGNSLREGNEAVTQEHLMKMRQVDWKRRKPGGNATTVMGTVTLVDGKVLLIEVMLKKVGDRYVLTGGVG